MYISYYVKNYLAGKKPTEIFIEAGFDPSILGNKRIERASARWRKLYADGQLIINTKENISVETKEEKIMNSEPTKKRRGRPRKNPVVETVAETKKEEYAVDGLFFFSVVLLLLLLFLPQVQLILYFAP